MSLPNHKTLCEKYSQANHRERLVEIFRDFDRVLVTSSFGTTSVILLHLLHQVKPEHPVHFIDTTYHFPETLAFVRKLEKRWKLNLVPVRPDMGENAQTRKDRTWAHKPDLCCKINKVRPLESLKRDHDVWISGMIGGTNLYRQQLPLFKAAGELIRFYPLIDMSPREAELYKLVYELPTHPLEKKGFGSVGCSHCTKPGNGREGRWPGKTKTECGLHL